MAAIKYWLWLSAMPNISARAKASLVAHYGDAEGVYLAPRGEYSKVTGVSAAEAAILERRDLRCVDRILADCEILNVRPIAFSDAEYPNRLKHIPSPPVALYVRGRLPQVDELPSVAVIGTRKASPYGLKMGRNLAYEIAKCGGVVVSVLSDGVDMAAAKGALLAGGACIGVLGTAHRENECSLYLDIALTGALVSEYPPGTKAQRSFFRDRNRIASGLSAGVVVVEAPAESGALLFANEAMEQGREIFAVPGNADSDNSVGTIELLKQGARPVTCGWDVMEELSAMFPGKITDAVSAPCPEEKPREIQGAQAKMPAAAKKVIDKENTRGYIDLKEQLSDLSDEQLKIIAAIDKGGSHIDDIIEKTDLGTAKVLSQLTVLEIKGYVRRDPGRRIILNTAKK